MEKHNQIKTRGSQEPLIAHLVFNLRAIYRAFHSFASRKGDPGKTSMQNKAVFYFHFDIFIF
jgi:hypothetical protein